jgi:hypothetical protein
MYLHTFPKFLLFHLSLLIFSISIDYCKLLLTNYGQRPRQDQANSGGSGGDQFFFHGGSLWITFDDENSIPV